MTDCDDLGLTPQGRSALRRANKNPKHLTDYDVGTLVELLVDGEEHVRETVAETIAEISNEADIPRPLVGTVDGLIVALDDENEEVRKKSARTLGRLVGTSPEAVDGAVEPLIGALNDERHRVRTSAAEALGKIGSKAPEQAEPAVDPLVAALNDGSEFVRREAVTALGRIGAVAPGQVDGEVGQLVSVIDDMRWAVRLEAVKAIGCIGSAAPEQVAEAVGPLGAAVNDTDQRVQRAAAQALGRIGEQSPKQVEEAVGPLIAALNDENQKVQRAAARALGRIGEQSPKQVEEAVGPLIAALDDEKTPVRCEAATALGHVGPAGTDETVIEAIDRLCRLLSSSLGTVRRNATVALGRLHAHDRSYSDVFEKALEDRFNDRKTLGEWLSEQLNDERTDVAVGAAFALFRAGVTDHDLRMSARNRLREGLNAADHRQFTIQLIAELAMTGPAIHPMMREVFAPDDTNEDPAVRDLIPDLIDLLDAPTGEIRRHACRALGHLDADAVEDLERLANEDDDEAVREAASEALERIGVDRGFEEGTDDATGADESINPDDVTGPDAIGTEDVVDAVASPPRRPGLSHDTLTVGEEVDAGGQAIISEAQLPTKKQPPETVALRKPDTSATLTREAIEAFLSRADTWATIDARERQKQRWEAYEHIVGVVATGDRRPWLAMEYMDGGDLTDLLVEHPDGLPVGQALWYGVCVCKGLEIAHTLGRAHLDVKPGNVLVTDTDGWPWPKLGDWGLARTLAEETGTSDMLSVEYAAPEQFDSDEFGDPDQLTDIYQTGALVHALLTGAPPASGTSAVSERRPEVPAAVDAAVGVALEPKKTDRYSSISTFGDALHALRTGGRLPPAVATRVQE